MREGYYGDCLLDWSMDQFRLAVSRFPDLDTRCRRAPLAANLPKKSTAPQPKISRVLSVSPTLGTQHGNTQKFYRQKICKEQSSLHYSVENEKEDHYLNIPHSQVPVTNSYQSQPLILFFQPLTSLYGGRSATSNSLTNLKFQ